MSRSSRRQVARTKSVGTGKQPKDPRSPKGQAPVDVEDGPGGPSTPSRWSKAVARLKPGRDLMLVIVGVVLATLGALFAPSVLRYWDRPQLSIAMSKAFIGSSRAIDGDGVHEYRVVLDLSRQSCIADLLEMTAKTEEVLPPQKAEGNRIVYGVYLVNGGQSEAVDVRLSFRSAETPFSIRASPNIAISVADDIDPANEKIRVVTIASIGPHSSAALLATLTVPKARFTIATLPNHYHSSTLGPDEVDSIPATKNVIVLGAANQLDSPIRTLSANEFFRLFSGTFGLKDHYGAPLSGFEIGWKGGEIGMRAITALTGEPCVSAASYRQPMSVSSSADWMKIMPPK